MSVVGAKLQTLNEELVYIIEDLKRKLNDIDCEISDELNEKKKLTKELEIINNSLEMVNESLNKKLILKKGFADTLSELETAYLKILESSETLISVAKMKSYQLQETQLSSIVKD